VGAINPLVDIYNGISLQFALPCGMEDIDTFKGDLRLTVTNGGDPFLALGDEE
jgi:DNA/RNA-binding domain of Phe-tRNA-synthetase-like protein